MRPGNYWRSSETCEPTDGHDDLPHCSHGERGELASGRARINSTPLAAAAVWGTSTISYRRWQGHAHGRLPKSWGPDLPG
jgi:hypothetical protein